MSITRHVLMERVFRISLCPVLLLSALGKIGFVLKYGRTDVHDLLISFLPHSLLLTTVAAAELVLCFFLIFGRKRHVWVWGTAAFGSALLWYRFANWWIGIPSQPCACLGVIRGQLGTFEPFIDRVLVSFAAYMVIGSIAIGCLARKLVQAPTRLS